jgi:hypothetical protein
VGTLSTERTIMEPAEILSDIIDGVLDEPALEDSNWDSFVVLANITPDSGELSAFRYTASTVRMMQITELSMIDDFGELQEATTAPDGATWQVCIVKVDRDTARAVVEYVYPPDAEAWEITPENFAEVGERLRPQPSDFTN